MLAPSLLSIFGFTQKEIEDQVLHDLRQLIHGRYRKGNYVYPSLLLVIYGVCRYIIY